MGYDFAALIVHSPALAQFVRPAPHGHDSIDFANPAAVLALNRALLRHDYGISEWTIPRGYLCPPLPGRADYIHQLADLLAGAAGNEIPRGEATAILDIGVGANCIYPILGCREYGWRFVGTEIDSVALAAAKKNVDVHPALAGKIELRRQPSPVQVFQGVLRPGERFSACMCNPPFHASAAEAAAGAQRKRRNLAGLSQKATNLVSNFGGTHAELWCQGGESGFVRRMVAESARSPQLCDWFTSLVSNRDSLPVIQHALRTARATEVRTIPMAQGQKKSRIVAWTFRERSPTGPVQR